MLRWGYLDTRVSRHTRTRLWSRSHQHEGGHTRAGGGTEPIPRLKAGRDRTLGATAELSFTCLGPGRPAPPHTARSAVLLGEEPLGVRGEAAAAREAGNGFGREPPGDAAKVQLFSQQRHKFPPGAFWDKASTGVGTVCRGQGGPPTTSMLLAGDRKGQAPVGTMAVHSPCSKWELRRLGGATSW